MLKIIIARAYSGKTTYIIDEIRENLDKSILSYVMVPEQLTLETELMMIEAINKPLFLCKVMSFDRFSAEVLSKSGGIKREYIDDTSKIMLIENILLKNKDNFTLYKNAVNKTGFLEGAISTITQLKKYNISYEELYDISQKVDDNTILSLKLSEISTIYKLLEENIKDKFVDNESRLSLLCEKIPQYSKNKKYKVYFDNYVSFTGLELNVIKSLLQSKVDITVTLPYDYSDDNSFDTTKDTLNQLIKIASELSQKYNIVHLDKSYNKNKELRHLEENFGKIKFKKYNEKPESISLKYFDKAQNEIIMVANEIASLVKNHNYRYKDIAVVTTDEIGYSTIIKEVFDMYDIPHFVDVKREITQENIINFVFSFLDIFVKSPNYNNIMSFFKTGMSDISKDEYEIFENYMLKWNMNERKYINEKYFEDEKYFANEFFGEKDIVIKVKNYIYEIYNKYKKVFKKKNDVKVFSKYLNNFLEDLKCKDKLENLIEEFKKDKNYEIVSEISQIWNVLLKTIDKIDMILEDNQISIEEYKKMLYQGLNSQQIAIIPPTIDSIIIMDIQRSKSLGYKALFMVGMNDTLLPRTFKSDIIFQDEDKYAMKKYNINLNSSMFNMLTQEKTAIYMILSKTREKLYLSYSISDINEKSAGKSSYINIIQNIFPNLKEVYISKNILQNEDMYKDYEDNMNFKTAFAKLREDLRDMVRDKSFSDDAIRLYKYFEEDDDFKNEIPRLKKALFGKNTIEKLKKEHIEKIYKLPLYSSVSQIQTYVRCPFSYYMSYGIRPQKRQNSNIDNMQTGTILHKYMEEFSKDILQNKELMLLDTKEKIEDFVDKIYSLEDFLENDIKIITNNSKRKNNIIRNLKKISQKATNIIIEQKLSSSFVTTATEKKIDDIRLDLDNEDKTNEKTNHIILKGVVDRIDELQIDNQRYIQVVDYKSSVKKIDFKEIYQGINIQLLFYLYALTKEENTNPYLAMYFPMIDSRALISEDSLDDLDEKLREKMKMNGILTDDVRLLKAFENDIEENSKFLNVKLKNEEVKGTNVISEDDMKNLIKHILKVIKDYANEILKGNIKPQPIKDACQYCDYQNICGFDESISGFEYKKLKNIKKEDIFENIRQNQDIKEGIDVRNKMD